MKKQLLCLISLLLIFSFSCARAQYTDALPTSEISEIIIVNTDGSQKYLYAEADYLEFIIDDLSLCDGFSLIYSEEAGDINEFGVFRASSEENTPKLYEAVKKYVSDMQENERAFIASYAPEELPKLDGCEVVTLSRYIIYAIGDTDTREKTISAVKDALAS